MEITNTADLLAFIPYAIDREPKNMLTIFMEMDDGKHAVCAFQLPDGPDPAFLKSVVSTVKQTGATNASAVIYSDDEGCEDGHPPLPDLSAILVMTFISLLDTELHEVITVGPTGWWCMEAPETKRPLSEIEESVMNATLIANGYTYRRGGVVIPEPTAATMTGTLRIANLALTIPTSLGDFDYLNGDRHYAEARALLSTLLQQGHGPSESQAQQMIAYFQHHGVRERLLGDIMNAPDEKTSYAEHIGGVGEMPFSVSKVQAGLSLLTNLLQYAEGSHRANLLAVYGWIKWLVGDREYVVAYIDAARALDAGLVMSNFIAERMLDGGLPPSAKRRPVA